MNSQIWGVSSAGRAPALQAGGHRFDPGTLHQQKSWQLTVKELTEVPWKWDFIEFLERETQNAPWKLNIESIMMQLWEQQLREIFYNWVIIIQFCKYLLLMSLHNSTNLRTNIGLFSVSWTDHREDESRVIEVKLIRAQGECLGIRSRWRTW